MRLLLLTSLLFLMGCELNQYVYEPPTVVTVHQSWHYECCQYQMEFSVYEDDLNTVYDCNLPSLDAEYGELVDLAFGPGLNDISALSRQILDELPPPTTPRHELEFLLAFVQSLSQNASFYYRSNLQYPLEVVFDGANSSATLSALAAAIMNEEGFPTGIAVFWNSCCPTDVHVSAAIADFYPYYHELDSQGTGWVFLETLENHAPDQTGEAPYWLDDYTDLLIWPLWESENGINKTIYRKIKIKNELLVN